MNVFKNDVKDIILTANNQGHQVEQEVQLTYHFTGSSQNESCTYSFVFVKSFDHQKVMMQHTKQLNTRDIHPNQHIKKYQTAISYRLKRK